MKLHLPSSLRVALLSCFSAVVMTFASGTMLLPTQAAEIYFNSTSHLASHITWQNGAIFTNDADPAQPAFATGDDVTLLHSATVTLGANVTAGVVNLQDKAIVNLTGQGNKLSATKVEIGNTSSLQLTDDSLATSVRVTGAYDSLLVFNFNGATVSYDTQLSSYKGRIQVNNCTWTTAPTANTAYSGVALTGNAVMNLSNGSVLKAPVMLLGENTVNVATGTATLQGELSGSGVLTKTGTGTLNIGPSDEFFRGTLVIEAGTVRWRDNVSNDQAREGLNRLSFESVVVNSGATFEDSHFGRNLHSITGIVLHGGTMTAADIANNGSTLYTATENSYASLHVEGSGTLDFGTEGARRFGVVTATSSSTLTVNNANQLSYVALDLIKDFDGTINGEAKNDNNKLIIGTVSQAEGTSLTVNPAVSATEFTKTGAGALALNRNLTAERSIAVEGGTMRVAGSITTKTLTITDETTKLTAESAVTAHGSISVAAETEVKGNLVAGDVDTQAALSVTGGKLTVAGNTTFSGATNIGAATVKFDGSLKSDKVDSIINITDAAADVTVKGETTASHLLMSGGQMNAAGVQIRETMALTGGSLTSTANVQTGDLLVAGGQLSANNLSVQSLTLSGGALNITNSVTISRQLTMNYGGSLTYGALHLADGAVLSYNSALNSTLRLTLSDLSSVNRLYVDVSQVSVQDLQSGLDLGLSYGAKDKLSIGSLADYTLENRDGKLFLVANNKTARYGWDATWGTAENAKAPETLPTVNWITVAEKPGLAGSPYYDKGNVIAGHVTGGTVTGNAPHANQIFGGAYGTQQIDAVGGTIERNIWLAVSGGTFEIVGGGCFSLNSSHGPSSGAAAAYNLKGDTHVQIENAASVGSVFGSNVNNIHTPTHTGNSYISVFSSKVTGSVVGSGYMTSGQTGDTYVNIYAPLYQDIASVIVDRTLSDNADGYKPYEIDANAVIGGVLEGTTANMQGNTNLNIDFSNAGGTMMKHLVGGHFAQSEQTQTGNTQIDIQHVSHASFRGRVVGGHNISFSNGLAEMKELEKLTPLEQQTEKEKRKAESLKYSNTSQTLTGNTKIHINDAKSASFKDNIVGGHYWEMIDGSLVGEFDDDAVNFAFRQTLEGDLNLVVENAPSVIIEGDVIVSGHYAAALFEARPTFVSAARQTQTGNTNFVFDNIARGRVDAVVVGGHYYKDDTCEGHAEHQHDIDTIAVQEHNGKTAMSISRAGGAVFTNDIVAGHYLTSTSLPEDQDDIMMARNSSQTQQGDVYLTIDDSRASYSGLWLVGGHYSELRRIGTAEMSHTNGDIHITIGNGIFRNWIVLGDVNATWIAGYTNEWNSNIEGSTNLTVTGGTFNGEIVGCSVNIDRITGRTGSVSKDIITKGGKTAHVGSVNMNLSNAIFNADIIGGFVADGTTTVGDINLTFTDATVNAEVFGGTATVQGNITLALHGGTFNGNIYAGGDGAEVTSSTEVAIDDDVQLKRGIRISGGFKGEGDDMVIGTKTLTFASAGSSYTNIASATFTEFDTVNVVDADTTVTLRQNLQLMGQNVTKTGEGTLVLYKDNELDNVSVRGGTLRLAGNSAGQGGTMIEHLLVEKNGTLDISAGNCGINGSLTMAQGAGLTVGVKQAAAAITDLNWEGLVEMDVLGANDADMDKGYEIKLFSGLSESHINGLKLAQIDGIEGLAAYAADYIDSDYSDGAFIVLREDGSLVLSANERQNAYWMNGSGEWNKADADWYGQESTEGTPGVFRDGARTFFVGNGTPADVQITEDVTPYSLTVREGTFTFDSATDKTISLKSDLNMEGADATFNNEVKFGKHSGISVDGNSSLALYGNDDVTVFDVDNAGTIDAGTADMTVTDALRNSGFISAASLELAKGTQQGGNVKTGTLKLGGDSTFDSVQATSIEVPTTLTVVNGLTTDSLKLAGNTQGNPTPFVTAGSVSTLTPATAMDIAIDNGVLLSNKALVANGGEFYMLRSDNIECDFTLNGGALSPVEAGRYHYDFAKDSHGLKVSSTVMNADHFSGMAETENGKAAATMVDSLFAPGSAALAGAPADLTALVQSLNTLDAAHDSAALEQLATAAAGASLPSLGLAVGNDMERQLRAIRNRTTTMGVDQTVTNEEMPYFNAWVNAEGDYRSVDGDKSEAGYTMSSFGGTVGFDADMTPHLTCGLALTAMHGKFTSDDIDNADGNVTTEYLSLFARYARHSWTHTFVASAGIAQADIDRTVHHAGGSYTASGDTDGTAFGLMYEVGRVIALNAEGSACIQPFANVSFVHANLSGFEEEGTDAGLTVDDMTYNAVTFGLGARLQGVGGETVYNRSAIYELRALAKFHTGDRSVDADTSFAHATPGTLHSAEIGAVGAEIGAGITLPVGGQNSSVFADVSVEFNSAYTQVNGTVGYRINF